MWTTSCRYIPFCLPCLLTYLHFHAPTFLLTHISVDPSHLSASLCVCPPLISNLLPTSTRYTTQPKAIMYYCTIVKPETDPTPCNKTLPTSRRDIQGKLNLVAGRCSHHLRKNCAGEKMMYSRTKRAFILEYYIASKSFAAVREACSNIYTDKYQIRKYTDL
jgi:hypothetical protein